MDTNKYRMAYSSQKATAQVRGIEFRLTFKEWCDFWGEDINRRGCGQFDLQMQRNADTGPYAIGNIKKGIPRQNSKTYSDMYRKRQSDDAALELQISLDQAMNSESMELFDSDGIEPHYHHLGIASSYRMRYDFKG